MNTEINQENVKSQVATLGGGCFWCLEAVYQELNGVRRVVSGYAGGQTANPDYEAICTGQTGHAEVVEVEFDPHVISFRELLEVFFVIHDPTTLNRQGYDTGTQYRSVIYCHDEYQLQESRRMIEELEKMKAFPAPIVTQVLMAPKFYAAEEYHQNYFINHPNQGYCASVVAPKLEKFRKTFSSKRR